MSANELLQSIMLDDLPPPLKSCAKIIGVENLYRLSEKVGGKRTYIPKPDGLFRNTKERLIREEYKNGGCTLESLAIKYDVSLMTAFKYTRE